MGRKSRTHSPEFKSKVALAAIKGFYPILASPEYSSMRLLMIRLIAYPRWHVVRRSINELLCVSFRATWGVAYEQHKSSMKP